MKCRRWRRKVLRSPLSPSGSAGSATRTRRSTLIPELSTHCSSSPSARNAKGRATRPGRRITPSRTTSRRECSRRDGASRAPLDEPDRTRPACAIEGLDFWPVQPLQSHFRVRSTMRFKHGAVRLFLVGSLAACGGAHDGDETAETVDALTPSGHGHAQVAAWFEQSSPEVLALPGTVSTHHDEATNRLVIGVENAAAGPGLRAAFARPRVPGPAVRGQPRRPLYQPRPTPDHVGPAM